MSQQHTLEQLKELKLWGMAQALQKQIEQPPIQDLAFHERLSLMVDHEVLYRHNRRIDNLLRQAKLKQQASIEEVDYQHARNLNKQEFIALADGEFIKHRHNLLITGPTGCGKSYLACAIGNHACRQGYSVRYLRLPKFLDELTLTHADGSYHKWMNQLVKIDLVILDDFALVQNITIQQRQDLFNLIEDRHQLKSLLITSQLPINLWHEYIGEPTIADAILDRLLQHSRRIELTGDSMRKIKRVD